LVGGFDAEAVVFRELRAVEHGWPGVVVGEHLRFAAVLHGGAEGATGVDGCVGCLGDADGREQ